MTIYQNTYDTGEAGGSHAYFTCLKQAASALVDPAGGADYDACVRKDYIRTTRLEEINGSIVMLDLTDACHAMAQEFVREDRANGRYDREHAKSFSHAS